MKLINFNAKLSQTRVVIQNKIKESGYKVDELDIAENTQIEIQDLSTIIISYMNCYFYVYVILHLEKDTIIFDEVIIE